MLSFVIVAFAILGPSSSHAAFSSSEMQYFNVLWSLQKGKQMGAFLDSEPVSCLTVPSPVYCFCVEGFHISKAKLSSNLKFERTSRCPDYVRALGRGIGLAQKGVSVEEIALQPFHMKPYVIDGWAIGKSIKNLGSYEEALRNCIFFKSEKNRHICAFGVGRSLYFMGKSLRRPLSKRVANLEASIVAGRQYAITMVQGLQTLTGSYSTSKKVGMVAALFDRKALRSVFLKSTIQDCLSAKGGHILKCTRGGLELTKRR